MALSHFAHHATAVARLRLHLVGVGQFLPGDAAAPATAQTNGALVPRIIVRFPTIHRILNDFTNTIVVKLAALRIPAALVVEDYLTQR
jgi:hypothetical protein